MSGVSHVNVSPSGHPPAVEPAEVIRLWSNAGGLPSRAGSQQGKGLNTLHPNIQQPSFIYGQDVWIVMLLL